MDVTHLTHSTPRRPGTTRRIGAPCGGASGSWPTDVARSAPSRSGRRNDQRWPVADTTVAFVTEELAFRRALVGPPDSAGLGTLVLMALVFGLWHVVQPGYGGAPLGTLLGTALGGFVAGCVYTLSGSLTAAALYHGLHNAPLKALGDAPIVTGRGGLASGVALAGTAALAVALGWMVWRRGGRDPAGLS